MLLQFSVKNFRSFKDEVKLSLEASSDKELENNLTRIGRDRVLKNAVVLGANASGKSNVFLAITAAIMTIRKSNSRQIKEELEYIVPFVFDEETAQQPTAFEFVFYAEGTKYVYGFSATRSEVVEEHLYYYKSAKASMVFERRKGEPYKFAGDKRELSPIVERNADNKLFLATATAWNCKSTRIPYLWFEEKINTYANTMDQLFGIAAPLYLKDADDSLHLFTNHLLHEADINIDDYALDAFDIAENAAVHGLPPELAHLAPQLIPKGKAVQIQTVHTIEKDDRGTAQFKLAFLDESLGTRHLFMFAPILKRAFETGETVCIDEFDSSLHPMLAVYLIRLFNDPAVNRAHAQLIISAHTMELLSPGILRRDQIYFTEKKRKTGISELYSLDEFSLRKGENVRKAYLLGRYGAVPDIPEGALL